MQGLFTEYSFHYIQYTLFATLRVHCAHAEEHAVNRGRGSYCEHMTDKNIAKFTFYIQ